VLLQCERTGQYDCIMVYMLGSEDKFIPRLLVTVSRSRIVSYSEGVRRNLHTIPESLRDRLLLPSYAMSVGERFLTLSLKRLNKLGSIPKSNRANFFETTQYNSGCSDDVRQRRSNAAKPDETGSNNTQVSRPRPSWIFDDIIRPYDIRARVYKDNRYRRHFLMLLLCCCSYLKKFSLPYKTCFSVAVHLEIAIHHKCSNDKELYENTVFSIAGAMIGWHDDLPLAKLLAHGLFLSPQAVLSIPKNVIEKLFDGTNVDKEIRRILNAVS